MRFHNGVPITVVGSLQSLRSPMEATSRRRAEEDTCREQLAAQRGRAVRERAIK